MTAAPGRLWARRLGCPLCLAIAFWPLPTAALEPFYAGLGTFEMTVARNSLQDTLEHTASQQTRRWSVAGSQTRGSVTPLRTFKIKTGHYCREFRETISSAAAGVQVGEQIACRNGAGLWVRVDP